MLSLGYRLPPELWLQIFQWATLSDNVSQYAVEYEPFSGFSLQPDADRSLSMRRTLVLVCRQWKILATELLYKDLIIKDNTHALHETLLRGDACYGKLVRRAVLPYATTMTPSHAHLPSIEILKTCSALQILVRPPVLTPSRELLRFEFDAARCPILAALKRLDWWHHIDASRSKGINQLEDVLCHTPNLQYLFIGGISAANTALRQKLQLPALRTLRLRMGNGLYLFNICRWSLPSLTALVADAPMGLNALDTMWDQFGSQLLIVEFGNHLGFLANDNITACLNGCTRIEKFNYHILFTAVPSRPPSSPSLQCVGLHLDITYHLSDDHKWVMIESHFHVYINPEAFPSLKRVRLSGKWQDVMSNPRWIPLRDDLVERGLEIVYQ